MVQRSRVDPIRAESTSALHSADLENAIFLNTMSEGTAGI